MIKHNIVHLIQKTNGIYPNPNFLFKVDKEHTGEGCKILFKLKEDKWLCLLRQR